VIDLNELLHDVLSRDRIWSWYCITLNTLGSINRCNNITSCHLIPLFKLGVFNINIVLENCTFTWELDDLSLLTLPPFIEERSVIFTVLLTEATTNTPDTGENEDPFDTLNLVVVQDVFHKFTNGHHHRNLHLWNNMLKCFSTVE
jgi:hypothetical protein